MPQANFLGLPPRLSDRRTARFLVLPVPYEGTVSYGTGAARGPAAILSASRQVELYDDELRAEFHAAGVATLKAVSPAATPATEMNRIHAAAKSALAGGQFLLSLGGEHSITAPLVRAAAERFGELSVLQIDAHADLRDRYGGTRHSHAAVMRRVLEITGRVAQVGIRNFSLEEAQSCPKQVDAFFTPRRIASDSRWIDKVLRQLGPRVYVTIDIDGFDPAYAPATGTPEPGGLDWFQVTDLLRQVCAERQVVSADIVEVAPIRGTTVTEFLAARLAYKIIAYVQGRKA